MLQSSLLAQAKAIRLNLLMFQRIAVASGTIVGELTAVSQCPALTSQPAFLGHALCRYTSPFSLQKTGHKAHSMHAESRAREEQNECSCTAMATCYASLNPSSTHCAGCHAQDALSAQLRHYILQPPWSDDSLLRHTCSETDHMLMLGH